MQEHTMTRREFMKKSGAAAVVAALPAAARHRAAESAIPVKIGVVGTGNRGRGLMATLLAIGGVEFPAVCDIDVDALQKTQKMLAENGQGPAREFMGREGYKRLMHLDEVDAVIIATPWDLHTLMSVYAMRAGKPVGCEVPIAYTLDECWELIETHEKTGVRCMQLENWSFRSDNLAVLTMIRAGLFGTMTHAHCAYSHDCIDHWYFEKGTGNTRWGAQFLIDHNRNQYPTHQQGPVLSWLNINRGDAYDTITSTASDPASIYDYFKRNFPDHPNGKKTYKQGDIVTTVVRTKLGKTIVINFDMQSPRPYDNRWTVQGTRGIYNEQRDSLYLTGISPEYHSWEPFPPYHEKYRHPWADTASGGHGGADGIMLQQFVKAIRESGPFPLDLWDGVLMASIGPLSEQSISRGSRVIDVPDFTREAWKEWAPYFALV